MSDRLFELEEFDYDDILESAIYRYRRYMSGAKGQTADVSDGFDWHVMKATENYLRERWQTFDSVWFPCDQENLPEPMYEFHGTMFSEKVIVLTERGDMVIDEVCYPHGIYGADTTPYFHLNDQPKVCWCKLPNKPKEKS